MSGTIISPTLTLDQEERVRELVEEALAARDERRRESLLRLIESGRLLEPKPSGVSPVEKTAKYLHHARWSVVDIARLLEVTEAQVERWRSDGGWDA